MTNKNSIRRGFLASHGTQPQCRSSFSSVVVVKSCHTDEFRGAPVDSTGNRDSLRIVGT